MKKRKIIKGLLISSSIAILSLSIPLSLCLTKKQENNLSVSNNISNNNISNTNKINNTFNPLNSNINYYVNNGFYTAISNNENVITIGQITYSLNNTNFTASVINIANGISDLTIPGMIISKSNFYNVTSIAQGACFNKQLSSVSFPDSIVSIGADAFANNLLTNITLPNSLVNLGNNAFSNNPFYEGTVINLPSKCVWNKNANLAPFNNNQNAGQFTRCVKYIIQNLAVYGYVYQSNCWKIVSWMPQVANAFSNEVKSDNHIFTSNQTISNEVSPSQPFNNSFTFLNYSLNYAKIQDNAIIVTSSNSSVQQIYGFSVSNNQPSFYWINPNYQATNNFVIQISNPNNNNKLVYSNLNSYSKTTVPISYGDVVWIYDNEANLESYDSQGTNCFLATGLQANQITSNNINDCGISQFFSGDYNSVNDQIDYFIVTQNGFIPYQPVIHVNINCLQQNVTNFNLTGTALANHIVTATIDKKSYEALSNSDGEFSIPITSSSPIALGSSVYVTCKGCLTYINSLVGKNPLNAGFLFEDGTNAEFGILPDGYTGNFKLWNYSQFSMPLFNNPNANTEQAYTSSNSISPVYFSMNITLTDSYTNSQNKTISTKVVIDEPINKNCANSLNTQIQKLKYNPAYTNTFTITLPNSEYSFYTAICNSNMIPIQKTSSNGYTTYTFKITNNNIYASNPTGYTYSVSSGLNGYGFNAAWVARNFMMVNTSNSGQGGDYDDYNAKKFYDPTALMWKTVQNITKNCESVYEKAVAINEWVYNNMTYDTSYSYGHTISQTFNHLEGVCGNYADLAAIMCMMAGLVSRVITGDTNSLNYFTDNSPQNIDHAWMQVWDEQLGSWITLDPTWDWFFPYGDVQDQFNIWRSNMNVSIVFWPKGTNYFSYFTKHMYDALLDYGRYMAYVGNDPGTYYPMSYAAGVSQLLNSASKLSVNESDILVNQ